MTTTLYGDAKISEVRGGVSWKIELEDVDEIIFIKKNIVDKIASNSDAEETLIALVLAYIKYVRTTVNPNSMNCPKKIDDEILINSMSKLIDNSYPIEYIIEWVRDSKWTEIERVFTSENPEEELSELI